MIIDDMVINDKALIVELTQLIAKHGIDAETDTPASIVAGLLLDSLVSYCHAINLRTSEHMRNTGVNHAGS